MSDELNEVWELYAEEGNRSLDEAESILLKLQRGAFDPSAIAALFRALHTFKGNARVMALSVIESRAHLAEDLIGLVRDEGVKFDESMLDLLLETVDVLRGMLENSLHDRRDVKPEPSEALADRLRLEYATKREGGGSPSMTDTTPALKDSDPVILLLPDDPEWPVSETDIPEDEASFEPQDDETVHAILFDDEQPACLADDPVYRQIYAEMAFRFLDALRTAVPECLADTLNVVARLADEAERLCHAASQMGLSDWEAALNDYLAMDFPAQAEVVAALDRFTTMAHRDFAAFAPNVEAMPVSTEVLPVVESLYVENAREFFAILKAPLSSLSAFGVSLTTDQSAAIEAIVATLHELIAIADAYGFPGPSVIIQDFLNTLNRDAFQPLRFQAMEFSLYEALAAIQRLSLPNVVDLPFDALAILQLWCAERMEESLLDINAALDILAESGDVQAACEPIKQALWRMYYTCLHDRLTRVDELCMVLIDLFERVNAGEMTMGVALINLTRSFTARFNDIMEDIDEGKEPDLAPMVQLLAEAGEINFTLSDTHTPLAIENLLCLPPSFHKVMTPESVRMAEEGVARGDCFYILRVDLNAREDLAIRFLEWMKSGVAEVVSNVTVFEGERSLFDFLIVTGLNRQDLCAALLELDPQGQSLCIEKVLPGTGTDTSTAHAFSQESEIDPNPPEKDLNSSDMLEYIGELVTAQSVVMHLLTGLEKEDWIRTLDVEMAAANGDWNQARSTINQYFDDWRDKIERLLQVESRVNALLESLQESAIAMRSRPAGLLLKPLAPGLETLARQHQRQVRLILSGEDINLDLSMLEHLTPSLRALLAFCALQSVEPPDARIAAGKRPEAEIYVELMKAEDHLRLIVKDDGRGILPEKVQERVRQLGWPRENGLFDSVMAEGFGLFGNGQIEAGQINFAALREHLRIQGGELYLANRKHGGLRCCITMPLAMIVMDGMVVKVGEVQYVIPIDTIQRIIHSEEDVLTHLSADQGRQVLRLPDGNLLPVQYLMRSGQQSNAPVNANDVSVIDREEGKHKHLFVVVGSTSQRVAVAVDELVGQQQVLIRPLQGYLSRIRGVIGCALLGSGDVGMVLNMGYVIANEMRRT